MNKINHLIDAAYKVFENKAPKSRWSNFLLVLPSKQQLLHVEKNNIVSTYDISTSKYGLGNRNESFQTPTGLHFIAKKIGHDMPKLTIFKGRKPLPGNLTLLDFNKKNNEGLRNKHFKEFDDVITSRILWLKGHENGINQGGDVDSYDRYIYIHGTAHEDKIGIEASHGCIRMNNDDIIKLFENVTENMLVLILDN